MRTAFVGQRRALDELKQSGKQVIRERLDSRVKHHDRIIKTCPDQGNFIFQFDQATRKVRRQLISLLLQALLLFDSLSQFKLNLFQLSILWYCRNTQSTTCRENKGPKDDPSRPPDQAPLQGLAGKLRCSLGLGTLLLRHDEQLSLHPDG